MDGHSMSPNILDVAEEIQESIAYIEDAFERYQDRSDLTALLMGKKKGLEMALQMLNKRGDS